MPRHQHKSRNSNTAASSGSNTGRSKQPDPPPPPPPPPLNRYQVIEQGGWDNRRHFQLSHGLKDIPVDEDWKIGDAMLDKYIDIEERQLAEKMDRDKGTKLTKGTKQPRDLESRWDMDRYPPKHPGSSKGSDFSNYCYLSKHPDLSKHVDKGFPSDIPDHKSITERSGMTEDAVPLNELDACDKSGSSEEAEFSEESESPSPEDSELSEEAEFSEDEYMEGGYDEEEMEEWNE